MRGLRGMVLWILLAVSGVAGAAKLSGREILDHTDDLYRGRSSRGTLAMTVVTAHWSRTLTIEFWTKGKGNSLIRVLDPKKERGTATLKSGDNLWNYLPKVNRVIKLSSSMMASSWMGSHFTNDDLVKESRMADDYTFTITYEGSRHGQEIIEITCIPKPEAPVVWGKVILTVRREDYLPLTLLYYDEAMALARTLVFSEPKPFGGRPAPSKLTMQPEDKPKERTEIRYGEIEFDVPLAADAFSLRSLQK